MDPVIVTVASRPDGGNSKSSHGTCIPVPECKSVHLAELRNYGTNI